MGNAGQVGIIGASAAGLYTALLYALSHPAAHVTVFEKNEKPGKKILATGNGHCNLLHDPFEPSAFNHPAFVAALLSKHDLQSMIAALNDLGIVTMRKGELLYPLSYSAASVVTALLQKASRHGIELRNAEAVVDVDGNRIVTNAGSYAFDRIVFAFGGKSQANLGSDGSMFDVLRKRGYRVTALRPSLCPIYSSDVPKSLFGVRHLAKVTYQSHGKTVYEESGEIQFKKDGLSGIAVMNASHYFCKEGVFVLDLFEEYEEHEFASLLSRLYRSEKEGFLVSILEKPLMEYVQKSLNISAKAALNENDFAKIAHFLKHMRFRGEALYDFDASQVTRGGIALDDVKQNLQSKIHPAHFFAGECLDIDGLCGGYNLGFALLSALTVVDAL